MSQTPSEWLSISPLLVSEAIEYNPDTGLMIWKRRPESHFAKGRHGQYATMKGWNSRHAGKPAAAISHGSDGFLQAILFGRRILAHHVAWCIHKMEWSKLPIIHANGDKTDNRSFNLEQTGVPHIYWGQKIQTNNTSGVKGVSWHKGSNRWQARLMRFGVSHHAGYFSTVNDAEKALESLALELDVKI